MARLLVLSYWNVNRPSTGGLRRVDALLEALGPDLALGQPAPAHPRYPGFALARDAGAGGGRINWGLFNFFFPSVARQVRAAVRHHAPSAIVLTSIWAAWPVRHERHVPLVLDAHDVLAVAMAERYGTWHPFTLLVRAWEARVARRAARIFVCSAVDKAHFVRLYEVEPSCVLVVPNGVRAAPPAPALSPAWTERLAGATVLFFMGKPAYQPNAAALRFLADRVLPELERQRPGRFKLVVCGGAAPPGRWPENMLFAGSVPEEELQALLGRADLCLAPVFTGSGTRLKILEYLAAGKPVLSTPKGAEGIEAQPDVHLKLAEPETFAAAIVELADAPDRAAALGHAGQALVRERYEWSACSQPLWRAGLQSLLRD